MATLRNKTRERLDDEKCRTLEGVIDNFLKKDGQEAEEAIWKLCYQPETEMIWMGIKEYSTEDIIVIRNELASQYRTANPVWEYGYQYDMHEKANTEEAKRLKKELNNCYAFETILGRLLEFSHRDIQVVLKISQCLKSRRNQSKFGGLKALGFDDFEAQYLLQYADLISAVFEEMTSKRVEEYKSSSTQRSEKGRVIYPKECKETTTVVREKESQAKESKHEKSNSTGVSPIELIQKREEIEKFFEALEIISQTPNAEWLSEHKVQVKELFIQCDKFK